MYYYNVISGKYIISLKMNKILPQYIKDATYGYFNYEETTQVNDVSLKIEVLFSRQIIIGYDNYQESKLHCGKKGLVRVVSKEETEIINLTDSVIYKILFNRKIIVKGDYNYSVMDELIRLLRIGFEIMYEEDGYSKIHMGIVGISGKVYGIVGPPNSGKTTFVLEGLRRRNISVFCSNDKTFLNDKLICIGSCQRVGIRLESFKEYLSSIQMGYMSNDKIYYWPSELMKMIGGEIVNVVKLNGVLCTDFRINKNLSLVAIKNEEKAEFIESFVSNYTDDACMQRIKREIIRKYKIESNIKIGIIENELMKLEWTKISGDFRKVMDA